MAIKIKDSSRFVGGIADSSRDKTIADSHAFSRAVEFRTDPQNLTLLPAAIKESGSVITDLLKWGEVYNSTLTSYLYGNTGNLYARTSAGSHSFLRQVANSHGNGLVYSAEDDFLYYSLDKTIGRYGPLSSTTPAFTDDFFSSQGGVPLNTNSLQLLSASSQYADVADTASLSITANLAISAQINPTTLPAVSSSMVIASKWNINGNLRSYLLDIAGVSGFFGDGSDGSLTISSNTTEAPIDSACTGTINTNTLTATNAAFTAGQVIFIHQTQGTGAGSSMRNTVASYTAGTITLGTVLNFTYGIGAQVRVLKQYTNVTINSGFTYTAKAWNGTVGGILGFLCSGALTVNGTLSALGTGLRGGIATSTNGWSGESTAAVSVQQTAANGTGGGGGAMGFDPGDFEGGGGGGGSHSTIGTNGSSSLAVTGKGATTIVGSADLTTLEMGGGGGGNGSSRSGTNGVAGGAGGGIILSFAATVTVNATTGSITASGAAGTQNASAFYSGSGGGAGGSILIKAQTATLNTTRLVAIGGVGGTSNNKGAGGVGGSGRIHLDYYTSYTGTSTPTLDATQDNSLVTNTSYQLRLSVSSNGTNSETLAMVFTPQTGVWQQIGISWVAATSTATFFLNGASLGTRVGTLTAIADTTARFAVGASFDSGGAATNFYNGLIDEVQIYNMTQSANQFFAALTQQISTTTAGLQSYYKFNAAATDASANANNLTLQNAPTYSTNVPFASPTTRLDIDQSATTAGNTYTVPTTISEASTDRLTFTPAKDPQKSLAVLVAAKGTGNWTVTVHDSLNTIIATATITNANMTTGYVEFTYTSLWRPLTNFTNPYHFHLTSTVADGTVTTTTASDLTTVSYRTYYQFLMTDTAWHPLARFLQFWVVGNEKWVGKYEATLYEPNKIALGAGWSARCFGYWQEYLVIGATRTTTNIYDTDRGRLYFWDGAAPTYNFSVEVPEGGINALLGVDNKLFIWAGYRNQLLEYNAGFYASTSKVKFLPKMEATKYSETYPQGVTMWNSLMRWGASGNSNSATLPRGVYGYGKSSIRYEDSLSCDFVISTGNTGSTVSIGLLLVVNNKLLIGWQDGTGFGMDYVSPTTTTFGQGTIEFLIDDVNASWKTNQALNIKAVFAPLVSGDSFSLKYKINDTVNWSALTTTTTVGATSLILTVPNGRFNEYQYALDFSTTNTATPVFKGLGFEYEDLQQETGIGTTNE